MKSWEKKHNIKKANLILETNHLWGEKLKTLSEDHIKYVLGIEIPLNESYYGNPLLIERIIQEQMLYEDLLKSLKDFAKEKINKAVDTIKEWKDVAAFMFKLLTNPQLLANFTDNFWKTFKSGGNLNEIKAFLTKLKLDGLFESLQNVIDTITKLTGFKKLFAAIGFASIAKYMVNKLKSLPSDQITKFISNYLSDSFIMKLISKITDFKNFLGVLQPIINTTEFLYKVLEPTINKFKQALNFFKKPETEKTPEASPETLDFSV